MKLAERIVRSVRPNAGTGGTCESVARTPTSKCAEFSRWFQMRAACYFCRTALKTMTDNVLRRNNFVEEILAASRRAENGVSCGKTGINGESAQFTQKEKSIA